MKQIKDEQTKSSSKPRNTSKTRPIITGILGGLVTLVLMGALGVGFSYSLTSPVYNRLFVFIIPWLITSTILLVWLLGLVPMLRLKSKQGEDAHRLAFWTLVVVVVLGGAVTFWVLGSLLNQRFPLLP